MIAEFREFFFFSCAGSADGPPEEGAGPQEKAPAVPLHGEDEGGDHHQEAPRAPHVRPSRASEHRELPQG